MTQRVALTCAFMMLCLCARIPLNAQVRVHYPDRSYSTLSQGNAQWIASPRGLYRYRFDDNVWSAYGPQNGLRSTRITALEKRNDVLWIGQAGAVSSFDLRSNTMLHFDSSNGLPLSDIRSIAFEGEYTWAGGEGGAARYDELIEEWQFIGAEQGLTGSVVHAMLPAENRMFFATEAGVEEYDPRYERWRSYPLPEDLQVLDAFSTDRYLWLLHDAGLLRFDLSARNYAPLAFSDFHGTDIGVILIEGDNFWLRTPNDLWKYDATTDALRPFLEWERLPDRDLREIAVGFSGSVLWFGTAAGVTSYTPESGESVYYTEAGGMPRADFDAMLLLGSGVAAFAGEELIYLIADENRWYTVPLLKDESADGGPTYSLDPAEGSFVDFGNDWRLDLSGSRSAWLFEDPLGTDELVFGEDPVNRNDLKGRLDLGRGRRISALYNDSDFEDVTYGAEYRGARDDVVQSFQWGDIRREQGTSVLGQSIGLFGIGGRAVYGERSPRYGRSLLEVASVSGHKTTARNTEVFHGRLNGTAATLTDADWIQDEWYHLRTDRRLEKLEADRVVLFRVMWDPETPGPDDLLNTDIGGVIANWRALPEGVDYLIDRDMSVLQLKYQPRNTAFAVRMYSGGSVTEALLSDGTMSLLEVRNRYAIGSSIIPSTLQLRIATPDGSEVPLTQFGIDRDGDGRVDPEFMDFSTGILRFPDAEPFPAAAYQTPAVASYTMQVQYESFSTSYHLDKRRIIRGSETVQVDGLSMNAGEDYVLDYTSGFLVFTRDGAVLDDSRVEISYEYVRNATDERFMQTSITLSPSDFTQASVSGGSFNEEHSSHTTNFLQGAGELRWQSNALDFRVQPEYRHTWSDSATGDAAALAATLSTPAARVSLRSSVRSDGYREPTAASYSGGRLRDDHALQGEYDITDELRAFATWRQRTGLDTLRGLDLEDRTTSGGLQWVRQDWPSITLRGDLLDETDASGERSRSGGRADVAWIPSAALLEATGFSSARITGYARLSQDDITGGQQSNTYHMQNYFLRTVFSPRPLFTINAWYQGDKRERDVAGSLLPDYQQDRLFIDALIEHVRGLSLGARLTADERQFATAQNAFDQYTSTSMQMNLRLAPGTWISWLQPFTLYGSVQRNDGRSYRDVTQSAGLFTTFLESADGRLRSHSGSSWYEARLEYRPMAELLYSITGRLRSSSYQQLSSSSESSFHEILQRLDWRPDSRSLYGAQFQFRQDGAGSIFGESRQYSPLLWAERRYSRSVLVRLMLNTGWSTSTYTYGEFQSYSLDPSANVTLSFEELPVLRRLELRLDAGYSYWHEERSFILTTGFTNSGYTFYNKLYLDLYPHPVLFIRFRYFLRWIDTPWLGAYNILGINGWEQPDAQLKLIMQL